MARPIYLKSSFLNYSSSECINQAFCDYKRDVIN